MLTVYTQWRYYSGVRCMNSKYERAATYVWNGYLCLTVLRRCRYYAFDGEYTVTVLHKWRYIHCAGITQAMV